MADGPNTTINVSAKRIAKRIFNILIIPIDDFELNGPSLRSYNLDSIIGAETRTWIFVEFDLD